jgi:hypothetical protein
MLEDYAELADRAGLDRDHPLVRLAWEVRDRLLAARCCARIFRADRPFLTGFWAVADPPIRQGCGVSCRLWPA